MPSRASYVAHKPVIAPRSQVIYEPDQPSFADEPPTNVLWGRVVALGVVLLLAFLIGRATGGSKDQVNALQSQLDSARSQIQQLRSQARAAPSAAPPAAPTFSPGAPTAGGAGPTTSPRPGASPSPTSTASGQAQSYTVRTGDSFSAIASRVYGNATLYKCIQTANPSVTALRAGQTLSIPPKASCTA